MLAEILVGERQALGYRLIGCSLDAHAAWIGQLLQSLRQHDAFAGDRTVGDHDLTHSDANTNCRTNFVGQLLIVGRVCRLKRR